MADNQTSKDRSSVISMTIKDKQALFMAYMPAVTNGGLFVPTKRNYEMGDELFLLVRIIDEPEPVKISGHVVWVSPAGSTGNRPQGVGIQFSGDDAPQAKALIERRLGVSLSLDRKTHTM